MTIKTKRRICSTICLAGFLLLLGAVGGLELGTLPLGTGTVLALAGLGVFAAAAYKGGFFRR